MKTIPPLGGLLAWTWLTLALGLSSTPARAAERQVLHNALSPALTNAAPLLRSSRWKMLNLTIGLPLRDREGLTNLLQQLYDPTSPHFRHYLTPEQFAQRFSPTAEDYQAVVSFAKSHGLIVTGQHPNRTLLDVKGAVAMIERAFHVTLNEYQHPTEGRTFYAPDKEPSLDLSVPVLSIGGLDNFVSPHPCLWSIPTSEAKAEATGSGPGGTYLGNDFRSAYLPGVTLTGAGQTVGLFELDAGYYQNDITTYENLAGLPNVPVSKVLLDGYTGGPGVSDANVEVSLDIEMAIAMAPGLAGVIVYEGSTANDILNRMATDNLAKQIGASWSYPTDDNTDQIFLQFAAQGQSFFNASGDSDAYTATPPTPTDDVNITIVGGTTLTIVSTGGAWSAETVWNAGHSEGSSGGVSTRYPIPSWQQGINMTASQGSTTMRNIPDVAMTADNIYVTFGNGQSETVGGTSCSTQLWAAFASLMNQLAATNGESSVGFINPALYTIGQGENGFIYTNLFHDITNGNNEDASSPTRFVAVPGYDLCTGWGTPNGGGLITAVGLPEPLQITPLPKEIFSGPVGGPFTPAAQTFSLLNNGTIPLNWSLSSTSSWLTVSPLAGTISPGGLSDSVTVSVAPTATNLSAGTYLATLRFTNTTDHFGQDRIVELGIVTQPVITVQPTNQTLLDGMTATFTVGTGSNALLSYQWQDDGLTLRDEGSYRGTATSTLTISNVSGANNGSYSVVLSNAAGVLTSAVAVLKCVESSPVFILQPSGQTALPGATASFSVGVVGVPGTTAYRYQWQLNGINLLNGGINYSGVTSPTLTISNVSSANAGAYSAVVSDFLGSTNSTGAELTVIPVTTAGLTLAPVASFAGGSSSGETPYGSLVQGSDGSLYGTTTGGGADSEGTVFRTTTNGALTTLLSFKSSNGSEPDAGLIFGQDGFLYGTASSGGNYNLGTLFRVSTGGSLTTLASMDGDDGVSPVAGLLPGSDGNFYGTALEGGDYGYGEIFRMTTAGVVTRLVAFDGITGANPSGALIQGSDGNLYGTTELGGAYAAGSIFKMSLSGDITTLYSFTGGGDGGEPVSGLVQAADGSFYGTTYVGGTNGYGTVFAITPAGAFIPRYSFTSAKDGSNPWGGLTQASDGNLYGTTQTGGTYGFGTVFQIAPTGGLTTIAQFDGYAGAYPSAALIQGLDGYLYGTTLNGGSGSSGSIYRLEINGPLKISGQPADQAAVTGGTAAFTVATFGAAPVSYQWQMNGVNLTNGGAITGANSATLTISNVTVSDAAVYTVVVSNAFNAVTSEDAVLEVVFSPPRITTQPVSQTCVEGMTVTLNVNVLADQPVSYQWQVNGNNLTDGGVIAGSATSSITLSNITVANAGQYSVLVSNSVGVVSRTIATVTVMPATATATTMTNLQFFNENHNGAFPYGGVVEGNDGNLYGTDEGGGPQFVGTLFRMTLAGSMTTLYDFPNSPGPAEPVGSLVVGQDGNLYGTAAGGGDSGYGSVFRLVPNTGSLKDLYSFEDGVDGAVPTSALIQGNDGNFYGTTYLGGAYAYGSVFKITPTGDLSTLYGFTGVNDGGYPYAGVIQGADGGIYGTTLEFGADGFGTVFRLDTNGSLATLVSFNETNGAFPEGGVIQGTDGNLYGSTVNGGSNNDGTIFCLTTNGALTSLFSFGNTNGSNPAAALVQGTDGNLYGTTSASGVGGQGTVFRITTNGVLTTLVWFDGLNGADPEAPLIQASDGNFYGATAQGGIGFNPSAGGGNGTIFRVSVTMGITLGISAQGTNMVLNWTGGLPPYQVKVTTDLSSGIWQNLDGLNSSNSLVLSPSNVSAYYQIQGQ